MPTAPAPAKHGLAAGQAPERADWTIDQGWANQGLFTLISRDALRIKKVMR